MDEPKPEHHEHHEEMFHEHHHAHEQGKSKSYFWPIIAAVLAVALVVSIYTNGFHFGNSSNATTTTDTGSGTGEFKITILNDARCTDCQTAVAGLKTKLKEVFPGAEFVEHDYSTEECKVIYEKNSCTALPVVLFTEDVKNQSGYSDVQAFLEPKGEYLSLRIGASFDPTKEICSNGEDDNGNGIVDCEDADCKESLECRSEKKNNVQVFIMSDCPYGKKAIEALKEVVDNFGSSVKYEVHYIANEAADGTFQSLHGEYEANEDIIQLCVKEHSPEAFLDYAYCRSTKGIKGVDWNTCATSSKVDVAAVEKCFDGDEGKELLSTDIKIAESLGIGASPTWLANNRFQFSGITAEVVKQNICSHNAGLKGCNATLTADAGAPAGNCG